MRAIPLMLPATALLVFGCGGSGGSATPPTGTVRRNAGGDNFQYSDGGTYTQAGVVTNGVATGTTTNTFTFGNFLGTSSEQQSITTMLNLQNGQRIVNETRVYDPNWVTIGQSDGATTEQVSGGGFALPGTLSPSTLIATTEVLANGTQVLITFKVTGSSSVVTPAGTFNCWTIQKNEVWSDGYTFAEVISFSPDLGAPAQIVANETYPAGFSDVLTYTLSSYHLGTTP